MQFILDWVLRRAPIIGPEYRIMSDLGVNSHFIHQEEAGGKKHHYLLSCTLHDYDQYAVKIAEALSLNEWRTASDLAYAYKPFSSQHGFIRSRKSGKDQAFIKVFPRGSHFDKHEADILIRMHQALGPEHPLPKGFLGWLLRYVFGVKL